VQHFKVKLFARSGSAPDLGAAVPVFHRWIQKNRIPGTLIDVADYRHVPAGPGVILVAGDGIYGLDLEKSRLGLVYTRRTSLDGDDAARLEQAVDAVSRAADLLEAEPEFAGALAFDRTAWEIAVNDRALAPNNDESWIALEIAVRQVFDARLGAGRYQVCRTGEPRELLKAAVSVSS
jgi:hypothetical protein